MGLKFMQRQKQQQAAAVPLGSSPAAGAASSSSPAAASATPPPPASAGPGGTLGAAAAAAAKQREEAQWTAPRPASASAASSSSSAPAAVVLLEEDSEQPGGAASLLAFRAGRRSFGGSNPRLEKRLDAISGNQRQAADEIRIAAEAEASRQRQAVAQAEVERQAAADAAYEQKHAVSDADLAAAFGKYVPASGGSKAAGAASAGPPVMPNPVRVRDAPKPSAGPAGGSVPKYGSLATGPAERRGPPVDEPERAFKRPRPADEQKRNKPVGNGKAPKSARGGAGTHGWHPK